MLSDEESDPGVDTAVLPKLTKKESEELDDDKDLVEANGDAGDDDAEEEDDDDDDDMDEDEYGLCANKHESHELTRQQICRREDPVTCDGRG